MDIVKKSEVIRLKKEGKSYREISKELSLSLGSVKSLISRMEINKSEEKSETCRYCGKPFIAPNGRKVKHFCSTKCRLAYWNLHRGEKESFERTGECRCCHKRFYKRSRKSQVYCSRECYIKDRYHH